MKENKKIEVYTMIEHYDGDIVQFRGVFKKQPRKCSKVDADLQYNYAIISGNSAQLAHIWPWRAVV